MICHLNFIEILGNALKNCMYHICTSLYLIEIKGLGNWSFIKPYIDPNSFFLQNIILLDLRPIYGHILACRYCASNRSTAGDKTQNLTSRSLLFTLNLYMHL